jgi:hypothetical protein
MEGPRPRLFSSPPFFDPPEVGILKFFALRLRTAGDLSFCRNEVKHSRVSFMGGDNGPSFWS